MRPLKYLMHTLVCALLLAGCSTLACGQEQPDDDSLTTTNPFETTTTTTKADGITTAQTTNVNTSTGKPPSSTQAPTASSSTTTSTTSKPTPKPVPSTTRQPVANCPRPCTCLSEQELNCEDLQLAQIPKLDSKHTFTHMRFARNLIEVLDFKTLRADKLVSLDLSDNQLRVIVPPKRSVGELPLLDELILSDNQLDSLANLTMWQMPSLEQLDVSKNNIKQLYLGLSNARPKLTALDASELQLNSVDENSLIAAPRLAFLNLTKTRNSGSLMIANSAFGKLTQLETLDLSSNALLEVPAALRNATSLKRLILNGNLMTSLRPSDFINLPKLERLEIRACPVLQRVDANAFGALASLKTLVISDNPRLFEFSPDAMKALVVRPTSERRRLGLLDLSANNLTTLAKMDDELMAFQQLRLANNPWDCTCQLEWLVRVGNLWQQQPIHCRTPSKYRDLELSQFFEMHDCTSEDSWIQRTVVTLSILFLLLVTIAVFVQKTDLCRRLRWRDQYGTIYYTKASFPQEQL